MFLDISMAEFLIICVIAAILLGPEKLPPLAKKAGRVFKFLRSVANNATEQIKEELGPEFSDLPIDSIQDLNPKNLVGSMLTGETMQSGVGGELTALRDEMESMRTEVTKLRLQAGAPLIPPRPRTPAATPEE